MKRLLWSNDLKLILFLIFTAIIPGFVPSQISGTESQQVGEKSPHFELAMVSHYSKTQVSSEDFKGEFIILDFWSRWCSACFENMPKVNTLQKKFTEKLTILMVGLLDNEKVPELYEKFRKKLNLDLLVAYDSTIFKQFGVPSVPHL